MIYLAQLHFVFKISLLELEISYLNSRFLIKLINFWKSEILNFQILLRLGMKMFKNSTVTRGSNIWKFKTFDVQKFQKFIRNLLSKCEVSSSNTFNELHTKAKRYYFTKNLSPTVF